MKKHNRCRKRKRTHLLLYFLNHLNEFILYFILYFFPQGMLNWQLMINSPRRACTWGILVEGFVTAPRRACTWGILVEGFVTAKRFICLRYTVYDSNHTSTLRPVPSFLILFCYMQFIQTKYRAKNQHIFHFSVRWQMNAVVIHCLKLPVINAPLVLMCIVMF